MSSKKKPPLPNMSIVGRRPEIYCLDLFGKTRKKCDKFNRNNKKVSYFLYSFDLVYSFPKNHLLQHKIITR